MKLNRADVNKMAEESKETPAKFVIPDLNFIIVSSRNDERMYKVKVDSGDGCVVFLKSVNVSSYAIIPTDKRLLEGAVVSNRKASEK
jgi:hypothetical protein